MHVLFCMAVAPEQRDRIADAAGDGVLVSYDPHTAVAAGRPITAVIGGPSPETLEHLHQLEWVQLTSDSLEHWEPILRLLAEREVTVTRTSGSYNATVPDHALLLLLALARGLPDLLRQRADRRFAPGELQARPLAGQRLVIVGFGSIGRAVAERAAALGLQVVGVDVRRGEVPPMVEEVVPPSALLDVLRRADLVLLAVPVSSATRGLIGAAALAALKPGALLVNVGRGAVVDTDALLEALDSGRLAGAALDVTEPEPLPPDHPLWTHPKVLLTGHSAAAGSDPEAAKFEAILTNLRRYVEGRELRGVVTPEDWR